MCRNTWDEIRPNRFTQLPTDIYKPCTRRRCMQIYSSKSIPRYMADIIIIMINCIDEILIYACIYSTYMRHTRSSPAGFSLLVLIPKDVFIPYIY